MTDLVRRIRAVKPCTRGPYRDDLLAEAADEIERLRSALRKIALDTSNPTNETHPHSITAREALRDD